MPDPYNTLKMMTWCAPRTSQTGLTTAKAPWQPRCLLDAPVYEVLEPHHRVDLAQTEGYVAVVAVALDDRGRLVLPSALLARALALSSATVRPARRADR